MSIPVELFVLCIFLNVGTSVHITVACISAKGERIPREGVKAAIWGSAVSAKEKGY